MYAFLVVKNQDGTTAVQPVEELTAPQTLDEIHNACSSVQRNIETQQVVSAMMNAFAIAQQTPKNAPGPNRTEGGLIVPDDIKVKKD